MCLVRLFLNLLGLFSIALAFPHNQIIDTEEYRDVGVVFTQAHYEGPFDFLIENRIRNQCYPFEFPNITNEPQGSTVVCVPTTCVLYTAKDCNTTDGSSSVIVHGPGDVPSFDIPNGQPFKSYICGEDDAISMAQAANYSLPTIPHDPKVGNVMMA